MTNYNEQEWWAMNTSERSVQWQKTKQKWTREKKKRGGAWEEMHGKKFEELWVVLNKQKKKKKENF